MSNDFEVLGAQPAPPPSLSTEQAHSGRYALRVAPGALNSHAVSWSWEELGRPYKLPCRAWAWATSSRAIGVLVMTVTRPGQDGLLTWQSLSFERTVRRYGRWVPVQKVFHLPRSLRRTLQPTDRIGFYLWQPQGDGPVYLDDLCLELP